MKNSVEVLAKKRLQLILVTEAPLTSGKGCNRFGVAMVTEGRKGASIGIMTQPLRPGRPKRSEFSHGEGNIPDPRTDYQSPRAGLAGVLGVAHSNDLEYGYSEDSRDAFNKHRGLLRSDPTNAEESLWPDMLYSKGNPDIYGPASKMVQEPVYQPAVAKPQPPVRYGVDRQE